MTAHTPGPWFQSHRKSVYGGYRTEVYTEDGEVVAHVAWYPKQLNATTTGTYREPNARLIAAAPDLLNAAQIALANLMRNLASEEACGQPFMGDDEHEAISVLRAAIAKARGEI